MLSTARLEEMVQTIFDYYNKTPTPAVFALYVRDLRAYEQSDIQNAWDNYRVNNSRGDFMPKCRVLVDLVRAEVQRRDAATGKPKPPQVEASGEDWRDKMMDAAMQARSSGQDVNAAIEAARLETLGERHA